MVALVAPILVFVYPPSSAGSKQKVKIHLDKALDQIDEGNGLKFEAPADTAFVMVTGGGANSVGDPSFAGFMVKVNGKTYGWSSSCSHLGCSINLNADAHRFECPCHGSMFNLDGSVLHGPAAFPLAKLNWDGSGADIEVEGMSTKRNFGG